MSGDYTNSRDSRGPSRRKWQFSLRVAMLFVLALSIILAVASQFPRWSGFVVSMTGLLLFPLSLSALLRKSLGTWGVIAGDPGAESRPFANFVARPLRWLGLWTGETPPSLIAGTWTAVVSTLVLVGFWPLLREVGSVLSMLSRQPIESYTYTWNDAARSMTGVFFRGEYWLRLWQWELWSVSRWWLLFGVIALAWLVVSFPFRRWLKSERVTATIARFLAFAPWFIFLEVAMLIGVWVESPNTTPEPSTGFVVGIFSWDLWHWDCWLNRGWLIRGAVSTWIAGSVFFAGVLRWRWPAGMVAAVGLIPIALLLSVAWTVAYQHGFPQWP